MSLLKKLAGETAIYGLSSILGRVVNWVILTPYFTRVFTTDEYGIVNDLYFYIAFLLVLFTYRMETAFFRFASRSEEHSSNAVFTTASLSILASTLFFTAVLFFAAEPIAGWLRYPERADYVRIFTLIIAFDALAAIPFARLRLDSRPLRFALIKLSAILINILLVFFFLEACPRLIESGWKGLEAIYREDQRIAYVFWSNMLASGLTLLWLTPLFRHIVWTFAKDLWQRMMRYSLPLVIAAFAGIVNQLIGTPLLKYLGSGSLEENLKMGGIYAAAAKLAVLMNLFVQAFNYAAEPFFFRQAAVSDDKAVYADVARAFALVGSLVFLGIMLYLDLIQYFLGNDFREGLGVLPILLVANFFLGLYYNFSIAYKLTDRTRIGGYIALVGSFITLLINFLLIPSLGYYAPAWASLACFVVMCSLAFIVARPFWHVQYPLGKMVYYLLLALGLWGLSIGLEPIVEEHFVARMGAHTILLFVYLAILYKTEWPWLRKALGR